MADAVPQWAVDLAQAQAALAAAQAQIDAAQAAREAAAEAIVAANRDRDAWINGTIQSATDQLVTPS